MAAEQPNPPLHKPGRSLLAPRAGRNWAQRESSHLTRLQIHRNLRLLGLARQRVRRIRYRMGRYGYLLRADQKRSRLDNDRDDFVWNWRSSSRPFWAFWVVWNV